MTTDELKACPFCGGENTRQYWQPVCGLRTFWRTCMDCGAEGPGAHSSEDADELWNRRAGTAALQPGSGRTCGAEVSE